MILLTFTGVLLLLGSFFVLYKKLFKYFEEGIDVKHD